jgi:integrase
MDEITSEHIEAWQDKKAKSGLAYNTIKRNYSALKTIIRQAITDKVIKSTQLDGFKLRDPSFKEQKAIKERADQLAKKRRLLTNGEIASLHNGLDLFAELIRKQRRNSRAHGKPYLADLDNVSLPHWFIPFCHFALHTGLRTGDLYSLTWQELNLNFAKLKKVTGKSTRSIRKGGVGTLVEMKLNQRIHSIMKQWWKQNKKPQTGLVFVSPITGGEFDMGSHNKPWKKVKELAGLPPELNFYSLRHHFISSLVSQGIPMLAVAKLAGHRSTEMIERHYGHLCEVQAAKAIDILGDKIDQAINN